MLAMQKSCSNMTWLFQLAQMKNWMLNKEVSSSSWNETQVVQKSDQPLPLETEMTVFVDNPQIRFKTRFTNTAKDHRIRLLVKTHNTRPSNDSESIYEVVTRPNKPAASWENPENPQHQQAFVSLYDDVKEWQYPIKDCTSMKFLEMTPWL